MNDDRCVICGGYVPEGRHVCFECEETFSDERFEKFHKENNVTQKSEKKHKQKRGKREEIRGY